MGFIFGGNTGETQQSLEAKRQIAMALAGQAISSSPKNLGEGLTAVGRALAYRSAMNDFMGAQSSAQQDYSSALGSILGGGQPASASPTSITPSQPQQPQIPAAAVSGGDLTNTAQPLSGGTLPVQTADASQPRGFRNNNPLNIEAGNFTQSQPGFAGSDGRFAQFGSMDQGLGAADKLLQTYAGKGINTVAGIVNRWAPPSDNNPTSAYAATVAKAVGVDPNAPLNMADPAVRQKVIGAMAQFENGKPLPPIASNNPNFIPQSPQASSFSNPQLAAMLSPSMTVGQPQAGPAMAFNGQPQSGNPLANPQAFAAPQSGAPQGAQAVGQGTFAPPSGAQPNVTNLATNPVQNLNIEGQNPGRAAVVQALQGQGQPQQMAAPASNIPPQVAETIRRLSMNPLPQAQQMASALMQRYMQPPQYDLMQGADGTVTAINKLNPRDNYVAAHMAPKPIAVAPGATLVTPGATGGQGGQNGFTPAYQNTTGLFDKGTLTALADQYLTGDKSVMQNLGRTAIGGMNITALRERIVSRAKEMGISPTEVASRIGQFDSYVSAQKATGTRGGNVTMAATEAGNLGNLVNETSAAVPRTNYPVWNKVTNAYAENTGDPNIVRFTGALNSYINAYARAINPSGSTTVSDKEHAREILDTAMSHGQIEAGIGQLQKELEQAKRAPSSASEIIKGEFMNRSNPQNSAVLSQARDAINRGADRNAVIQRLRQKGIDPSGL